MLASSPGSFKFSMLYRLYIIVPGATLKIGGSLHAWLTLLLDSAMFLVTFCYSSHYLLPDFYQLRHVLYYSIFHAFLKKLEIPFSVLPLLINCGICNDTQWLHNTTRHTTIDKKPIAWNSLGACSRVTVVVIACSYVCVCVCACVYYHASCYTPRLYVENKVPLSFLCRFHMYSEDFIENALFKSSGNICWLSLPSLLLDRRLMVKRALNVESSQLLL